MMIVLGRLVNDKEENDPGLLFVLTKLAFWQCSELVCAAHGDSTKGLMK